VKGFLVSKLNEKKQEVFRQITRIAIYESVVKLLAKHELDEITMQMVAKEAGMATGSLYNYFKNKNELIDYALERICNGFFEAIRANAKDGTPSERIRSVIGCCFEFVTEKNSIFIAIEAVKGCSDEEFKEKKLKDEQDITNIFKDIIAEGITGGQFKDVDPKQVAKIIFVTMLGTWKSQTYWEDPNPERESEVVYSFIMTYLGC
jgi:AcrR family transcriptional regulator